MADLDEFVHLIPRAVAWAQQQEQQILANGTPLSSILMEDAKVIRVKYPQKVRVLCVKKIPLPEDPDLRIAAQDMHLITPATAGLALRYGIFLRDDCRDDREIIVHELVHTSQYERLGGIQQFLTRYLMECIQLGYPDGPLEQEAIHKAKSICS